MCQGTARERLAVCDHHVHVKEKVGWVFLFVTVSALEGLGRGAVLKFTFVLRICLTAFCFVLRICSCNLMIFKKFSLRT